MCCWLLLLLLLLLCHVCCIPAWELLPLLLLLLLLKALRLQRCQLLCELPAYAQCWLCCWLSLIKLGRKLQGRIKLLLLQLAIALPGNGHSSAADNASCSAAALAATGACSWPTTPSGQ
jgi:hypothetical protein